MGQFRYPQNYPSSLGQEGYTQGRCLCEITHKLPKACYGLHLTPLPALCSRNLEWPVETCPPLAGLLSVSEADAGCLFPLGETYFSHPRCHTQEVYIQNDLGQTRFQQAGLSLGGLELNHPVSLLPVIFGLYQTVSFLKCLDTVKAMLVRSCGDHLSLRIRVGTMATPGWERQWHFRLTVPTG